MSATINFSERDSQAFVPQACRHVGCDGHVVQFYSEDRSLLAPLSRKIESALSASQSVVIIATEAHQNALRQILTARGAEIHSAAEQGRYIALDAARTLSKFMLQGRPDAEHFAATLGSVIASAQQASPAHRVMAFGEMVALLWAEGNHEAALELERLWNNLAQTHSFQLHCAYPLAGFRHAEDSRLFLRICAEHSDVIPTEAYTDLADDKDRLRAVAELQQKAQALEFEKSAQESLRKANRDLEATAAARHEELRKMSDSEHGLRQLSHRLLRVQDEERRRVGTELHDSVAQYLAMLKVGLEMLRSDNPPAHAAGHQLVTDCVCLLEHSVARLRSVSYWLYPPMMEEAGLQTAIRWYLETFTGATGIKVTLDAPPDILRLPRDLELTLFRVLQESLANVQRHSGSDSAVVLLRVEDRQVCLQVRDSGKGIAPEALSSSSGTPGKLGIGLRAMEERLTQLGGQLHLASTAEGTTLTARLPLTVSPPAEP